MISAICSAQDIRFKWPKLQNPKIYSKSYSYRPAYERFVCWPVAVLSIAYMFAIAFDVSFYRHSVPCDKERSGENDCDSESVTQLVVWNFKGSE